MKSTTAMFFQVIRQFDIKGGGTGVVLMNKRTPDAKEEYYVANSDSLFASTPGLIIEIPCRLKGDAIVIPEELILFAAGTLEDSSRSIRRQYLSYLYNDPLHTSRRLDVSSAKNFDSKFVFTHPTLKLLESLHDLLHTPSLHEQLVEINYQYSRASVFTRFRDDPDNVSYRTPRTLLYYPMENLVRVTFALGGVPEHIQVQVKEDEHQLLATAPVMVNITRIYRNEGWTSLRDIAHKEPKLREFIRMFYSSEYGKPETNSPSK
jgi:hypothetical protein